MTKLTLLAGGDTVYLYPDTAEPGVAKKIAVQRALLDVAYPGDDTLVRVIDSASWDEALQAALRDEGLTIVDTREDRS